MRDIITLDYGSGGGKTSKLISDMILPLLGNEVLSQLGDGAVLESADKIAFSTDSFVVDPIFFPGGDIGKMSVCGTVNDIAMAGGVPKYLSLSFIIEEGLPTEDLSRIIESIHKTAEKAGVQIVTGDTKVVERGHGDNIYINTAGIGFIKHANLSPRNIKPGDKVLLSGTAGDHGTTIMLTRDLMNSEGELMSDCAPLGKLAESIYYLADDLRVLRDPTRGGVATTLCEFVEGTNLSIELEEEDIPVDPSTRSACDMLGLDPLYCANEGKMLAIVSADSAEEALATLRAQEYGEHAAIIGEVTDNYPGKLIMHTDFGGSRILTKLAGSQLPRIC